MRNAYIIFFFCLWYATGYGQALINRYDPGLHNKFLGAYALNDSTYRVFSKSDLGSVKGYSSFIVTDYSKGLPGFRDYNVEDFDYPPLYGTYELFHYALPNGDAILVGNYFDCDIGGFSAMYMTADYHVDWFFYSNNYQISAYNVIGIGVVSPDVLAWLGDNGETIYVTIDGEQVWYDTLPSYYTHVVYNEPFTFGFRNAHWFKLDLQFQVIDSIAIDTIAFVAPVDNAFLIQTNEKIVLVDSAMQIKAERDMIGGLRTAEKIGNTFGIANDHLFMFLDSNLQIIQAYQTLPFERMEYVMGHIDTAYLLSSYNGVRHTDFITRLYVPGQLLTTDSPDLRLNYFQLPDTVLVAHPYGQWFTQWQFGPSLFSVENLSEDTIHNFRLECNWSPFGVNCTNYERTWTFDSVNLLPGESRIFDLEPFNADSLVIGYHSPFCFWIESPNGFPDPNPNDNYACDAAQIVTASQEISREVPFNYFPNPCQDILSIELADHHIGHVSCSLYSADGKLHHKSQLSNKTNAIHMTDVPPGMYFIRLQDDKGHSEARKLIIQE